MHCHKFSKLRFEWHSILGSSHVPCFIYLFPRRCRCTPTFECFRRPWSEYCIHVRFTLCTSATVENRPV